MDETHTQEKERRNRFGVEGLGYIRQALGFDLSEMKGFGVGSVERQNMASAVMKRRRREPEMHARTLRNSIDGNFPAADSTSLLNAAQGSAHIAQKFRQETRLRSFDRRSLK